MGKQESKNKESNEIKKELQKQDSTATLPTKMYFTTDSIKQYVKQDQKDMLLSYESIASAINDIDNEEVKKELIACLRT